MNQKVYHVRFKRSARGGRVFLNMENRISTSEKIEMELTYNQICRFLKTSIPIEVLTEDEEYISIYSKDGLDEYIRSTYENKKEEFIEISEQVVNLMEPILEQMKAQEIAEEEKEKLVEEEHVETINLDETMEVEDVVIDPQVEDPITDENKEVVEEKNEAQKPNTYQNNQNKNYQNNKKYNQPQRKK